jgi:hypothetical protein
MSIVNDLPPGAGDPVASGAAPSFGPASCENALAAAFRPGFRADWFLHSGVSGPILETPRASAFDPSGPPFRDP